jgi:hypothetical protein
MFLRLTHAISRQQELLADALAARTVHPLVMASALRRTTGLAPAFRSYWQFEVTPALNAGCLPPIMAGFDCYRGRSRLDPPSVSSCAPRKLEMRLTPSIPIRHCGSGLPH